MPCTSNEPAIPPPRPSLPAPSSPAAPVVTAVGRVSAQRVVEHLAKKLGHIPTDDELHAWAKSLRESAEAIEEYVFVRSGGFVAENDRGLAPRGKAPPAQLPTRVIVGPVEKGPVGKGPLIRSAADFGQLRGLVSAGAPRARSPQKRHQRRASKRSSLQVHEVRCGNEACRELGHGADQCPKGGRP